MTKKSLTQSRLKELLDYDQATGIFTRKISLTPACKVGDIAGGLNVHGYIQISVDGAFYLAHRLAWLYMTGAWPANDSDHKNRIRDDNRWKNLREATRSQNLINTSIRSDNTSGCKGVSWASRERLWRAYFNTGGKTISLGYFEKIEDAISTRKAAEKLHYKEFAA